MGNDWTGESFDLGEFKVYNKVWNPLEIAHGSGHEIKLFFEPIFGLFSINKFETAPLFIVLFDFMSPSSVSFVAFFNETLSVEGFRLWLLMFRQQFLEHVVDSQGQGSDSCKFDDFICRDYVSHLFVF